MRYPFVRRGTVRLSVYPSVNNMYLNTVETHLWSHVFYPFSSCACAIWVQLWSYLAEEGDLQSSILAQYHVHVHRLYIIHS